MMVKIGDCTLYNEDCIKMLKKLPEASVDLVMTSPPYNLKVPYKDYDDHIPWPEYYSWCERWLVELYRVMKNDGRICINHYMVCNCGEKSEAGNPLPNEAPLLRIFNICERIGFKLKDIDLWDGDSSIKGNVSKGSVGSASCPYMFSPCEGVLVMYKKQWKKALKGISTMTNAEYVKYSIGNLDFPAEKNGLTEANFPIEMPLHFINFLTYKGDVVCDPFSGSGTTAAATVKTGRKFFGSELSKEYFDISVERLLMELHK